MSLFADTGPVAVAVAQDLSIGYGHRAVLTNITWRIMPGEWWFLLGPNGAGKSTLIKALLGLLPPLSGGISLARSLEDRRRLGYVPQALDLSRVVPTTTREFVATGLTGLGLTAAVGRQRVAQALAQVGVADDRRVVELSGGQRQRTAIARALVRDPLLLVIDEPTTGLDVVAQEDLMDLLHGLHRQGQTIVTVAHDLHLTRRYASHIARVEGDRLVTGPADEELTPAKLARSFGRELHA